MQDKLSQEQLEDIVNKLDQGLIKGDTTENIGVKEFYIEAMKRRDESVLYDEDDDLSLRVQQDHPLDATIYTGGTFDLFHAGHVELLKRCAEQGKVIVALNTDEFVERYKGKKPIMSFKERLSVLSSCRYVSKVIENYGNEDSSIPLSDINPDYIAIGSDWLEKDYLKQMNIDAKFLEENGITLMYIPRPAEENRISSTEIKRRIRDEA